MINSAEEFVRLRESEIKEEYQRAANDSAFEVTWLEVIKKYPDMKKWVAHNKTIPKSILEILAEDNDEKVKMVVARRRSAGEKILNKLAEDQSEFVRLALVTNSKVSKNILLKLINDDSEDVMEIARKKLQILESSGLRCLYPGT